MCLAKKEEQLQCTMPVAINSDGGVQGSIIYEKYGTDDLILEFFSAPLNREKGNDEMDYSQNPVSQTFIVDYPLLAYKSFNPNNSEICVAHMAMNIP